MDENEIRQLVEMVKQGDQAAFESLYMLSGRAVYFICAGFLGNEEDAKDIMQEVYITAYEKLDQLNDGAKFVPWINQIAVNKCKTVLLKKSSDFIDVEDMDNQLTEENENFLPEEYITQKEKRKLVMDIMRKSLSDIQYRTVILYYFNGLTIDEIADIMECPSGTVKYRLSVSRAKIKDGVQAYEKGSGDRLYSVVGLPLLMQLLHEEAKSIIIPDLFPQIINATMSNIAAAGMSTLVGAVDEAVGMSVGAADGAVGMSAGAADGAVGNIVGEAAGKTIGGIVKKGIGTLKVKIVVGTVVAAVVGFGVFFIINNNSDEASNNEITEDMAEQNPDTERTDTGKTTDTEKTTEDTEQQALHEPAVEEPEEAQRLEVVTLEEYSKNGDGKDVISGHIKDISCGVGYDPLTILGDDGHLYVYSHVINSYKIYDLGKPSWNISDIDNVSFDICADTGDFMLVEGNHYYYVSMEDGEIIATVDGTMFDGRKIRKIGSAGDYPAEFNVYCDDGGWYRVAVAGLDEEPSDNFTYVDSKSYLRDSTIDGMFPDGMELKDMVRGYLLSSDGKLYMVNHTDTPIEGTEAYTFTKLYDLHQSYDEIAAITDTNDMIVMTASCHGDIFLHRKPDKNGKLEIIDDQKIIKLPDAEILDLWDIEGELIIKTPDGYYRCNPDEDTDFKKDEVFNSLTKDVVEISGDYVLLSDGHLYEFQ